VAGWGNHEEERRVKRLRVGVIGAGRISAGSHLPCLVNYGDVDLVLCEVDEERLAAVATQFRIRDTRLDYRDMLARDGVDAAIVLTPPAATFGVAKDCLSAGVPTLLEKPPGMTTAETRELLATALASGTDAMVAVNRRFNPLLTEARRLVEERGRIATIVAEFYQFSMPLYRRLGSPEESLASIIVPGSIHTVDLIRYLGGDVAEVYARADAYFDRHPDSFTALIRFQNGATGLLNYNLTSPIRLERVSFHGNEASAVLEGLADSCTVYVGDTVHDLTNVRRRDPSSPEWSDRPFNPFINGWWHQDRFFLDAVREGRRIGFPGSNLEDGVKTMELIDMIRGGWNGPVASA
jgi:predicted dehydrogenase